MITDEENKNATYDQAVDWLATAIIRAVPLRYTAAMFHHRYTTVMVSRADSVGGVAPALEVRVVCQGDPEETWLNRDDRVSTYVRSRGMSNITIAMELAEECVRSRPDIFAMPPDLLWEVEE